MSTRNPTWAFPLVALVTVGFALGCDAETETLTAVDHSGETIAGLSISTPVQSVQAGQSISLQVVGECVHGLPMADVPVVQWTVNDPRLASVGNDGAFSALHSGRVKVSAKFLDILGEAEIEVLPFGQSLGAAGGRLTSLDGGASIDVPAGALGHNQPITVEAAFAEQFGEAAAEIVGGAYEFGPNNRQFQARVRITLHYGLTPVPDGMEAPWFRLHRFENGAWMELPDSDVDTEAKTVSGLVDGLSLFAILPTEPFIETVEITPSALALKLGESSTLTAAAFDPLGTERTDREVLWTVDDPSIATVDGEGLVTAVEMGTATVTATCEGVQGSAEVVVGSNVNSIVMSATEITLEVGDTYQLAAVSIDVAGADVGRPIKWKSHDMTVARVNAAGLVTAMKVGLTKVRAEADGHWTTTRVTVVAPVVGAVELRITPLKSTPDVGEDVQHTATFYDSQGQPTTGGEVTWSTLHPNVASMNGNGLAKGLAKGVAVIQAVSGNLTATAEIIVGGTSGPPDDPGGHDDGFGNNLSWPVVFAEGVGITGLPVDQDPGVRPTAAEGIVVTTLPFFAPTNVSDYMLGGTPYYEQQGANTWRAEWADGTASGLQSAEVEWGDNLTHQTWNTHSIVRIEHVLTALSQGPLQGYDMAYLYGSGQTEMQGTDGTTGSYAPTVYTVMPSLIIERIDDVTRVPVAEVFNGALADGLGQDGPGFYGAEVNVAGKIIYGYNFFLRNVTLPAGLTTNGWWRITYELDDNVVVGSTGISRNTALTALVGDADPELQYVPNLNAAANRTWLDIYVSANTTGGGGGGGQHGPPSKVTVTPGSGSIHVGDALDLVATITDPKGIPLTEPVLWSSSDPAIASVDANGKVTGVSVGKATITGMSGGVAGSMTVDVTAKPDTPGGGHDDGYGNNLSWPVVFAEGYGITGFPVSQDPGTRPTPAEGVTVPSLPFFAPTNVSDYMIGTTPYYQQQTANTWSAEWVDGSSGLQSVEVKWGDNLTHHTWNTHSMIRVEHTLNALSVGALQGYNMAYLFGSGPSEMQGTDAATAGFVPTVYTVAPRLIIQKLDENTMLPVAEVFNGSIAEGLGSEGPGYYNAEVNVAGKIIFGYNFFVRNVTLPANIHKYGWWRITFALDDQVDISGVTVPSNVSLDACADASTAADEDEDLMYVPQLDPNGRFSWLDIWVDQSGGGGGGKGGGGGSGGGNCGGGGGGQH